MTRLNTAIFIFDDVELLDFAGPFEVFSACDSLFDRAMFNVYTVARDREVLTAKNGLLIKPHFQMDDCPRPDILLVPGGKGSRALLAMPQALDWVRDKAQDAQLVLSVCTGALVLAKAGLLKGLKATTHHLCFDELRELGDDIEIHQGARFMDNGKVVTSAGVAAGMDMCLHVTARLYGREAAQKTADYIEYDWPRLDG